jgi:hypothetical protein
MLRFAVKLELPMAIAIELEVLAGMRDALFFTLLNIHGKRLPNLLLSCR